MYDPTSLIVLAATSTGGVPDPGHVQIRLQVSQGTFAATCQANHEGFQLNTFVGGQVFLQADVCPSISPILFLVPRHGGFCHHSCWYAQNILGETTPHTPCLMGIPLLLVNISFVMPALYNYHRTHAINTLVC